MKKRLLVILVTLLYFGVFVHGQNTDVQKMVGQIKINLDSSMKNLHAYEWVETTGIFKGEEQKSQKQNKCSYGADNKVAKVPVNDAATDDKSPRGLRGKVAENKKEEISEYVKKAIAKVHEYLPPKPDKLQAVYVAGKTSVQPLEPNKKYKIGFSDYLQAGDMLGVGLDKEKNLLTSILVNTYMENPDDKISFTLKYAQLPDGTQFPAETVLDLPKEGLKVVIKNDQYKKR